MRGPCPALLSLSPLPPLPLPVVLSAHLILKCKRVNYVIFPRRPCLFANSITNMAGASFGLSSTASLLLPLAPLHPAVTCLFREIVALYH